MSQVTVTIAGHRYEVSPDEVFTFGRARDCTACLDPADTALSRLAGSLGHEHGTWWVTNRSAARPLAVVDEFGFRSVLAPGRRIAAESPIKVIVDGAQTSHTITVEPAARPSAATPAEPASGTPTAIGAEVLINASDRLAMVALFAGYLEDPPRYDPYPKSYNAAAARLGWPRTTLVKRIEYLRTRLDAAGVPNMMGWNALTNLAEYALSRGLIVKDDLVDLHR